MTWDVLARSKAVRGPLDVWLEPRLEMLFTPSPAPIDAPVAKLGGQPVWLDEPFWPVSASSGEPMTFVGQLPLPGPDLRLSYLFLTDDDEGAAETYDPEGGENALLIQPGGRVPRFVTGVAAATGPTLWRRGQEWTERVPVELRIDLRPPAEAAGPAFAREIAWLANARRGIYPDPDARGHMDFGSYVGGAPRTYDPWTIGLDAGWRFFFRLDGGEGWDGDLYALNFGGGYGYALVSVIHSRATATTPSCTAAAGSTGSWPGGQSSLTVAIAATRRS